MSINIPTVLSEVQFVSSVIPFINNYENTFFISILDPDNKNPYKEDSENYKTFYIWDIPYNIGNYESFTYEQAQDMYKFIKQNEGKDLVVHCAAGVSRSPAVAEFYYEMLGGSWREFKAKYKHILPNMKILQELRIADSEGEKDIKINFI